MNETQNLWHHPHLSCCLERGSLRLLVSWSCTAATECLVSDTDKDKGLFMVSCYICKECENVNVSILKDYTKKVNSWCAKNVKRKVIFCHFFYIITDDRWYIM